VSVLFVFLLFIRQQHESNVCVFLAAKEWSLVRYFIYTICLSGSGAQAALLQHAVTWVLLRCCNSVIHFAMGRNCVAVKSACLWNSCVVLMLPALSECEIAAYVFQLYKVWSLFPAQLNFNKIFWPPPNSVNIFYSFKLFCNTGNQLPQDYTSHHRTMDTSFSCYQSVMIFHYTVDLLDQKKYIFC
jgi:hypothetical protein